MKMSLYSILNPRKGFQKRCYTSFIIITCFRPSWKNKVRRDMDFSQFKGGPYCHIGLASLIFLLYLIWNVGPRLEIRWRNSSELLANIPEITFRDSSQTTNTTGNNYTSASVPERFGSTKTFKEQPACRIPKLTPFDVKSKDHLKKPPQQDCTKEYPLLFESTKESELVPTESVQRENFGITSCCYKRISRGRKGRPNDEHVDNQFFFSNQCFNLPLTSLSKMKSEADEFVAILCDKVELASTIENVITTSYDERPKKIVDMHTFVPLKASVEVRVKDYYSKIVDNGISSPLKESERINVVIFGIDSTSRMDFIRFMPKTYRYLKKKLAAVEYIGFNKVGDNTLPNIAPMLAYRSKTEIKDTCVNNTAFDDCPFIWKNYSAQGYRTSYGEDAPGIGIFSYLAHGFLKQPTDYYIRPFMSASDKTIGTHKIAYARLCYGPRLAFQVLLDYMKKIAFAMGHTKRYFQFIWSGSLTHDSSRLANLGDQHLKATLKWFNNGGYLNDSVIILTSDHGKNLGTQGHYERSLPFLFFIFPKWFKKKYSRAFNNLKNNRKGLSSAYDMYQTLQDLLDLRRITNNKISKREVVVTNLRKETKIPRGISLFLPLPKWRTCEMMGIEDNFCVCHDFRPLPRNASIIRRAGKFLVHEINMRLSKHPKCAFLNLTEILNAAGETKSSEYNDYDDGVKRKGESFKAYQVTIKTFPGDGIFEALVTREEQFKVAGTITRLSRYGNQSHCIEDKDLKPFCFCKDGLLGFATSTTVEPLRIGYDHDDEN